MAYLLGLEKQQARVPGSTELEDTGQGVPALQPRYVLLDAATKRPVPGQQIRRKGQALEVWVDGKLVLVLPAFFTPKDGVESLNDLQLGSLDGALTADQLTNPEEHTATYLLTEEAWDTENTFDLSELDVSPTSWRESDLWAQASGHESMANASMTDAATGAASATTSGAVSTTVTGSVSGMGLGAVGLLLGMSTIASHVNDKVSVVPGSDGISGGGSGGGSQTVTSNGSGSFTAGPAVAGNGLHMKVYRADTGALLEDVKVADDGSYSFNTTFVGVVILVIQDVDADPDNPGMDYMDEAGGLVDLSVDLRSIAVLGASGGAMTANVTPLTEIAATIATGKSAAQAAAAGYAEATLTPTAVANTNKALAKVLGFGDNVDVTSASVTPITDANGNVNTGMNNYGRVLAALSHAGDLSNVIATMAAGIRVDASGNPSFNADAGSAAQVLMAQGMAEAETAQGISFSSMPALQTVKTAATKAYSSVLIANMLKADDLLGPDLTKLLNAAKTALQKQTTDWDTLSNAWVNNSSLNANLAFFEAINTNKGGFDNALGQAFNKALDQAKLAEQLLGNTKLSAATLARAQASYDQALASLKQQAQTALDRIELQGLKQADMAADWADGQNPAALARLGDNLELLSAVLQADTITAKAWQASLTQLTAAQKNLSNLKAKTATSSAALAAAQAEVSNLKSITSLVETSSADQAAVDLSAWQLLGLRKQNHLANPNDAAKQAAWMEALATEATQVQGDQVVSDMLAVALEFSGSASQKQALVKEALMTKANRLATDRVFADALSQAIDTPDNAVIDTLQTFAANKAEVDQMLLDSMSTQANNSSRVDILKGLMAAQAASEKVAAQNWAKTGGSTQSNAFRALESKNNANKSLLGMLSDAFVEEDGAKAALLINKDDPQAKRDLSHADAIIKGVVKSFSQEALYQVQSVMAKTVRIDEKPASFVYADTNEVLNPAQESVTLGMPELANLTWSLVSSANNIHADLFNLSADGELSFKNDVDFEANAQVKTWQVTVRMKDAQNEFVDQEITVNLGDVNEAPTVKATITDQIIAKGRYFNLNLSNVFGNVDANDPLTFTATSLPQGLSINASNGQLSGTPNTLREATNVTVTATDASGLSVSQSFKMSVMNAPGMQSLSPAPNSKTLVKAGDTFQVVLKTTEALTLGGNGRPLLNINFNGDNLQGTNKGSNAVGDEWTFEFTAPAKSSKVLDGNQLTVTSLNLNGGTLVGQTSGLSFETTAPSTLATSVFRLDNTAPEAPGLQLQDEGISNRWFDEARRGQGHWRGSRCQVGIPFEHQ